MDKFERDFEHLDVQTQTMDEAMSGVTTLNMPEVITIGLISIGYEPHYYRVCTVYP